jgi:hypothetical protein
LDNSSGFFAAENGSGGGSVVQNYFTPNQNYGVSGYNVPQLLTWSTVYDLPVGRGKRFLNKGPLSWVLGNWGMNYVFIAHSGQPVSSNPPPSPYLRSHSEIWVRTFCATNRFTTWTFRW